MFSLLLAMLLERGLGSDCYETREATSKCLEQIPALRIAIPHLLQSEDLEVVRRAKRLPYKVVRLGSKIPGWYDRQTDKPILICVRQCPGTEGALVNYDTPGMRKEHPDCEIVVVNDFYDLDGRINDTYGGKCVLYINKRLVRVFGYHWTDRGSKENGVSATIRRFKK